MKTKHGLLFGFAVIAIAAMVTLAGCPTDDGDGDGGITIGNLPNGNLGTTLTISDEQVYEMTDNDQGGVSYTAVTGNKTVTISGATGTASISSGKLTVSITAPTSLAALSDMTGEDGLGRYYDDVTASVANANFSWLELRLPTEMSDLSKSNNVDTATSMTSEKVEYIYVDKDVTITGKGKTTTETYNDEDGSWTEKNTTSNFTLNLKTGWNAVYTKAIYSKSGSTYSSQEAMAVGNPTNLKWYYYNWED